MGTVRDILNKKGIHVHTIDSATTVYDALDKLEDLNIGALVIIDHGHFSGIFTERDYARKVVLQGRSSKETKVADIMAENTPTVTPEMTLAKCMDIMSKQFVRHLPVMIANEVVGIISMGDVMRFLIEEKQFIIENLENYISR